MTSQSNQPGEECGRIRQEQVKGEREREREGRGGTALHFFKPACYRCCGLPQQIAVDATPPDRLSISRLSSHFLPVLSQFVFLVPLSSTPSTFFTSPVLGFATFLVVSRTVSTTTPSLSPRAVAAVAAASFCSVLPACVHRSVLPACAHRSAPPQQSHYVAISTTSPQPAPPAPSRAFSRFSLHITPTTPPGTPLWFFQINTARRPPMFDLPLTECTRNIDTDIHAYTLAAAAVLVA